ncbi:MAG: helix-turn-helix transcriptional regulator [Treponema sp.]|jgi:transcriptional regulator with XRE-family HTH domain|nr:helix-turn-helix transcriptional regulator [Treponema sp.]
MLTAYKNMTFQELFIANLKEYRKLRNFSQFQLAELLESTQAYIAEIEVGKKFPSPAMIERIAGAFGIESYHLFQNRPVEADIQTKMLTPVQRKEISDKIHSAVLKIVDRY